MSNQSIIEHKANMFYVEFREDYLAICLNCSYKKPVKGKEKSKASPYCKALILAISESWTNEKRGSGSDLSFYMTYPQWIDAMYGMFGRNVVIDSVDELIGENLLSRIPHRLHGKDTFRYLLSYIEINKRMKNLADRLPYNTRPQVNGFTSKRDEKETGLQVNGMAFTNQPDTRLQVTEDPFTKGRNIESTNHPDLDSSQHQGAYNADVENPQSAIAPHTQSQDETYVPDFSQEKPTLPEVVEARDRVNVAIGSANRIATSAQTAPEDATGYTTGEQATLVASAPQQSAHQEKPAGRKRQPAAPKVDPATVAQYRDVFDSLWQEVTQDESGYAHTKTSDTTISDLLKGNLSKPKFVTPAKLRAVYLRLWNMPKDPRTGFLWQEHMSIKAVCKNYEEHAMALTAQAQASKTSKPVCNLPDTSSLSDAEYYDSLRKR